VIRLAIRVRREQAELVLAELLELAPAGVEELEPDPETVEFAVYGAPGELPSLPALDAICAGSLIEISTSELPDDWHERWKEFHKPVVVPAGAEHPLTLRIRPPWDAPAPPPRSAAYSTQREIVIDPGQAFGTGGHASTRLCLELLLELLADGFAPGPLLDVGTGSGVLAIAGGMLGFGPLLGVDYEEESVEAAVGNALANGVALEVRRCDLRSDPIPWLGEDSDDAAPAEPLLVMANLLRPLLLALSRAMSHVPDALIMGGLLVEEVDEVVGTLAERHGMREHRRVGSGDWAAVWLGA
jgi:ribosomal protein L11 methyltransferase